MAKYREGELVLVSNGNGCWIARQVVRVLTDNKTYRISSGYYCVEYSEANLHKCPKSIQKLTKLRRDD